MDNLYSTLIYQIHNITLVDVNHRTPHDIWLIWRGYHVGMIMWDSNSIIGINIDRSIYE
jgi:hypothetical protein